MTHTNKRISALVKAITASLFLPNVAFAQAPSFSLFSLPTGSSKALTFVVVLIAIVVLGRVCMGIFNVLFLEEESLASIEKRHPYLPSIQIIISVVFVTVLLFLLALKTMGGVAPFDGPHGWMRMAGVFGIMGVCWVVARLKWPATSQHYLYATMIGTIITFILISFHRALLNQGGTNPYFTAAGVVCLYIVWRFLFGPWRPRVKVVVLSTFIFWVGVHIIFGETDAERLAHLLAIIIALIPALIWCALFLGYHRQRVDLIILMFLSGMLSTAPILFYDAVVRRGIELHFFLFKIVPESFTQSTNMFVTDTISGMASAQSTLVAALISFLFVGLIEEFSKFWVLRKSGETSFTSIEDVMQMAIIVAIGFAFAENILNPRYFLTFVQEHLVAPEHPDWAAFLGNVLGRAVLTHMVHIVSTGVLGYFYGWALFAQPLYEEGAKEGKKFFVVRMFHKLLRLPESVVLHREMLSAGFICAVISHGVFNFLVTVPSILPGHPRTIGDLIGSAPGSLLHSIAILMVPSLLYVVGGFWLLTVLFHSKSATKKRGYFVQTDTFVNRSELA